jgi:Domain of unknown function (DUF4118)
VLAVARFAGILYALPVGVATILAFDWYFLPPLRNLDRATVLVPGLFLAMAVIVGAVATQAGRRGAAQRTGAPGGPAGPRPSTIRRIASADSSCFGKNAAAGLSAIGRAKSAAE